MEKKIFIGTTKPDTYDRRPLPITIEVELKEKSGVENFQTVDLTPITPPAFVLSISGNIGNSTTGQIDGTLYELVRDSHIYYRPEWDDYHFLTLLKVWGSWHMNDSKAGCKHQNESGEAEKTIYAVTPKVNVWKIKDEEQAKRTEALIKSMNEKKSPFRLSFHFLNPSNLHPFDYLILDIYAAARKGEVYKPKTAGEQSYFDGGVVEITTEKKAARWVYPTEHPDGILNKPCPVCGYKYGSQWLFEPIPQEIIDYIIELDESTPPDLEDADKGNVRGFVRNHKITIELEKVTENKTAPEWKEANHFKVTLHFQGRQMTTYYSQGFGIKGDPTAADVLNALTQDARTLEDYPDPLEWAENLGFETGSKTAKIFKATQKNTGALKKLMSEEYAALLEVETL